MLGGWDGVRGVWPTAAAGDINACLNRNGTTLRRATDRKQLTCCFIMVARAMPRHIAGDPHPHGIVQSSRATYPSPNEAKKWCGVAVFFFPPPATHARGTRHRSYQSNSNKKEGAAAAPSPRRTPNTFCAYTHCRQLVGYFNSCQAGGIPMRLVGLAK